MTCPEVGRAAIVGVASRHQAHRSGDWDCHQVREVDWCHVPLKSILQSHFEVPVFVGKDTTTAILGEQWYGAARHANNLIYVWVGTGIAVGILLDGRVYAGATGMAGEFGHTSIEWNGARCKCGNEGCLEGLASLEAIATKAASRALSRRTQSLVKSWRARPGHADARVDLCCAGRRMHRRPPGL